MVYMPKGMLETAPAPVYPLLDGQGYVYCDALQVGTPLVMVGAEFGQGRSLKLPVFSCVVGTVDWPLVIMNVKADALKAHENEGNYSHAQIGDELAAHVKSKGIDSQISLISAEHGTTAAVLVTGLSARSCTGLEHYPDLLAAFTRIEVDGGVCVEGSTMRFWFQ